MLNFEPLLHQLPACCHHFKLRNFFGIQTSKASINASVLYIHICTSAVIIYFLFCCFVMCEMAFCLQACASFCLRSPSCLSFQYSIEQVSCVWYPTAQFDHIDNRTGYWFYTKHLAEVTVNYIVCQFSKQILVLLQCHVNYLIIQK